MVNVIGGKDSSNFQYFVEIMIEGAIAIRRNADTIITLVEIMSYNSTLLCFQGNIKSTIAALRERRVPQPDGDEALSLRRARRGGGG